LYVSEKHPKINFYVSIVVQLFSITIRKAIMFYWVIGAKAHSGRRNN